MARNGRLPSRDVERTVVGVSVRKDLAKQTNQLAYAFYRKFGYPMAATDGYRTYAVQVILKIQKGPYAATPGTSNHGWGTAIDWASGINSFSSETHRWLRSNGGKFGWVHPTWAHDNYSGNGMDEPWHFEAHRVNTNAPYVGMPGRGSIGYGQRGKKVREVQNLLHKHGFRGLKIDSDFGMATGHRVVLFQEDQGLVQDGVVGPKTLAELRGNKAPAKPSTPSRPAQPREQNPLSLPTLQVGSDNGWVVLVQIAVGSKADGVFGNDTKAEVIDFQKRHNLVPDGIVGPRTWIQFLYGGLSKGDRGNRVRILQNIVGLRQSRADGIFGDDTVRAVEAVQRALGIRVDGVAGPGFRAAVLKFWNK